MERDLFDNLTRAVASGVSRRSAIRALFSGGAAAVAGIGSAAAKDSSETGNQGKGKRKPDCCPTDRPTLCDYTCVDTYTDPDNCGSCGSICASGVCNEGVCAPVVEPTCTDGIKNRDESDVDCGGVFCPECADGKTCNSDADCQSHICVSGICEPAPTCTEADNGTPCDTGLMGICAAGTIVCQNGTPVCVQTNQPRAETCNGFDDDCDGLVDEGASDVGQACDTGQPGICSTGITVCQDGAIVCLPNQTPQAETCNVIDDDCDGVVDNGAFCPDAPNATGVCNGSAGCGLICDEGFSDCNNDPSDGCETDLTSDVMNCGSCGGICSYAPDFATPSCTNGVCGFTCNPGFRPTPDGNFCEPIPPAIVINVPEIVPRGQPVNATVTLRDVVSEPTTVLLAQLQPPEPAGEYSSPTSVVVPAGFTSATFQVTGLSSGFGTLEANLNQDYAQDTFQII